MIRKTRRFASENVALVLAVGMVTALNVITIGVIWGIVAPYYSTTSVVPRPGENVTQILIAWGSGIISVLASYVGYVFGRRERDRPPEPEEEPK